MSQPDLPEARPAPPRRSLPTPVRAVLVVVFLYLFLVGVSLLESGITGLGDGFQQGLLDNVANPLSGLFAGVLFTVLVQSSSVSTSTIVGLVGAGTLPVELAVPMVMGANIGTTVTSTLAALGAIRRSNEFRRGFAAATVHDFFNVFAVAFLLPLELLTGVMSTIAVELTELLRGTGGVSEAGTSPVKAAVDVPVSLVTNLLDGAPLGDRAAAIGFLVVGLACIFAALAQITRHMRQLVAGGLQRAMNRIVGRGGGTIGILVGLVVTVAVQSSTITTSILVPMVAAGVLTVGNAYPITLGANIGTTVTALLASLAVLRPEGLTIALVHVLFNVTGIAVIYPVRRVREIPVRCATWLADLAVRHRTVVIVYLLGLFLVVPLAGIFLLP